MATCFDRLFTDHCKAIKQSVIQRGVKLRHCETDTLTIQSVVFSVMGNQ